MFNGKQKLRYLVNEYGTWLKIDDLYGKMKKYVWKIEKGEEFLNERQTQLINSYTFGLQGLESGTIDIFEEKVRILDNLSKGKAEIEQEIKV